MGPEITDYPLNLVHNLVDKSVFFVNLKRGVLMTFLYKTE